MNPVPVKDSRQRVLWVNARLLHPLNGGDRIRTYHMLRQLKKHCQITYICPKTSDDTAEAETRATEYCDDLRTFTHRLPVSGSLRFYGTAFLNCLIGSKPFASQKYASHTASKLLRQTLAEEKFDFIIADYLMSWIHFSDMHPLPGPPVIVFQHNVESLIWQRHTDTATHPFRRWICRREFILTQAFEEDAGRRAAGQITVSEEEEHTFRVTRGMKNVLGWVPTGVDCDFFTPAREATTSSTLAFLGSMDWHANVDAVEHFVRHSYPSIKARCPSAKLLLIGRNPAPAVRGLAAADPSIEVTGTVDDVRPYLARASIMILPLRVGGGTRIKVFEGMAAGLALVSSQVGVEGLPVVHGEHALLAEEPLAFADAVVSLLQDPPRREAMAEHARHWVQANFSWSSASMKFLTLCRQVQPITSPDRPHPASGVSPAGQVSNLPQPST